jgi:hypothetical protein
MTGSNGNSNGNGSARVGTSTVKQGLAQMLKGGVIVSFFLYSFTLVNGRLGNLYREVHRY